MACIPDDCPSNYLSEWNFLFNPKHPDFTRVEIVKIEPFEFDPKAIK